MHSSLTQAVGLKLYSFNNCTGPALHFKWLQKYGLPALVKPILILYQPVNTGSRFCNLKCCCPIIFN
jgi:hypothetical protein